MKAQDFFVAREGGRVAPGEEELNEVGDSQEFIILAADIQAPGG